MQLSFWRNPCIIRHNLAGDIILQVVELVSSAIRDLMCAEFTRFRDKNGYCTLPEGSTLEDWENQTYLSSGSLLGKSCQSAMILANHSEEVQHRAHHFGTHIAMAHQVRGSQYL